MRVDVLGWVSIQSDEGVRIALAGEKTRLLLALLACRANQKTCVDMVVDALWGARPPKSSTANIQTYIWRIRRALGAAEPGADNRLSYQSGGYGLCLAPGESDIQEIQALTSAPHPHGGRADPDLAAESLRRAYALWRGRPFSADAAGRSHVVAGELYRCEELYLQVCEAYAVSALAAGAPGAVLPVMRRLIAEFPIRERLYAMAIRSLTAIGDGGAALGLYHQARTVLGQELGAEPGGELRALHRSLLRGEPLPSGADAGAAADTAAAV
ncbi:AfsR/SARP family transcriptional regulator [Solwaraspora sp. WMMB335]|uniref:AfsR/SARP family transcriptional regulator n=1 Tax=Solwaraspora sp. WMMB335 TaxID=3404118 RepID=UPI003B932B17